MGRSRTATSYAHRRQNDWKHPKYEFSRNYPYFLKPNLYMAARQAVSDGIASRLPSRSSIISPRAVAFSLVRPGDTLKLSVGFHQNTRPKTTPIENVTNKKFARPA